MTASAPGRDQITGVILAGGRARRMGGIDKGLLPCAGRALIEWALAALVPQVGQILISANRNLAAYGAYGHPVVADPSADHPGPLAGIAAALATARTPWILLVPCDTPLLPPDLASRLGEALERDAGELALAHDGRRLQPLHALLPVALAPSLARFLAAGERQVAHWYANHRSAVADLSDQAEAFANINSPADAERLRAQLLGRTAHA
jgi:molybdopterin-guanine dinucleotide biosynthesis protein A